MSFFSNTIGRVKATLEASVETWRKSGSLYRKPAVISRHERQRAHWVKDCLNAVRIQAANLRPEEADRTTFVVFWKGHDEASGKVNVDIGAELHETVMADLASKGIFEMFPSQLGEECGYSRAAGAIIVVCFNTHDPANATAACVQIMRDDPELGLTPDRVQQMADVTSDGRRPAAYSKIVG